VPTSEGECLIEVREQVFDRFDADGNVGFNHIKDARVKKRPKLTAQ